MELAIKYEVEKRIAEKKLSVSELERRAGLKQGVLRNIIQGKSKNPTIQVMVAVAKVLDCSIEELLGKAPIDPIDHDGIKVSKTGPYREVDYQLLDSIYQMVLNKTKRMPKKPSGEQVLQFIADIYTFAKNESSASTHKNFCDWYLSRLSEPEN